MSGLDYAMTKSEKPIFDAMAVHFSELFPHASVDTDYDGYDFADDEDEKCYPIIIISVVKKKPDRWGTVVYIQVRFDDMAVSLWSNGNNHRPVIDINNPKSIDHISNYVWSAIGGPVDDATMERQWKASSQRRLWPI